MSKVCSPAPSSYLPMSVPTIQWYPGHIAKAERALTEQLKKVDVILEVRDARIPLATCHPQMEKWVNGKERVLVLNRVDMIPPEARQLWQAWFKERGETPCFVNANQGNGVANLAQATQNAGAKMNQRRRDRGMLPRPVRAVVIGFPNVGKSALINRLLKRRVVDSARRAGVTRQLRWVRISEELELLDAPGVLPSKLVDQQAALHLAFCDDIGEAAYDNQRVAAALLERIQQLCANVPGMMPPEALLKRYKVEPGAMTGESYLEAIGEQRYQSDREKAARQVLNDFRKGVLGAIPLELPGR
jgi:ribosome biogenesis GTPase A